MNGTRALGVIATIAGSMLSNGAAIAQTAAPAIPTSYPPSVCETRFMRNGVDPRAGMFAWSDIRSVRADGNVLIIQVSDGESRQPFPNPVHVARLKAIIDWQLRACPELTGKPQPARQVAAAAPLPKADRAPAPAPVSAPRATPVAPLDPVEQFGVLAYLAGKDWLVRYACDGGKKSDVAARVQWSGKPGKALQQVGSSGTTYTFKVGKKPDTVIMKTDSVNGNDYPDVVLQRVGDTFVSKDVRYEVIDNKLVQTAALRNCVGTYAGTLLPGIYDKAKADLDHQLAEKKRIEDQNKGPGILGALASIVVLPFKILAVIGEAYAANPEAFNATVAAATQSSNAWKPSTPSDWASRINTPGMGTSTYVSAPRMNAQQQAQADELERFKMAEQRRLGERPTTFGQDAYVKTQAQNRQIEAQRAERAERDRRQSDIASAERDREAADAEQEANRQANLKRQLAEKAEQDRKQKLFDEEQRRKKEAIAAREREQNELIEWREGMVLCAPAKAPSRNSACHGPLQTTYGTLNEQSGNVALSQACGVSFDQVREAGQSGGYIVYGCGFGIHPSATMRNVPMHGDPAARLGVGYVDGRTYRCPRKQTNICRN
ncbi:MAG: hypothetical protein V4659_09995 [Pseudomonadota bacterium]